MSSPQQFAPSSLQSAVWEVAFIDEEGEVTYLDAFYTDVGEAIEAGMAECHPDQTMKLIQVCPSRYARERDEARAELDKLRKVIAAREQQLRELVLKWRRLETERDRETGDTVEDLVNAGYSNACGGCADELDAILSGG